MQTKFARSSRRHLIGRAHVLHVMNTVEPSVTVNDRVEDEYLWAGTDDRGVDLTIVGILLVEGQRTDGESGDLLLIIHVMPNYRSK